MLEAPNKVPHLPASSGGQMLNIATDIQSLTAFRRNSAGMMKQLRKSKRPLVLTLNGKAAAVVQDAEAYQRLLDVAARADTAEGIRQGLEDIKKGRSRPVRQFFDEFESARGLSR
jgi:PHD/YefM family antitoxin component YafN of YafNO toxin-antitoxin module